jgi:hypothetical protein
MEGKGMYVKFEIYKVAVIAIKSTGTRIDG